MPRAFSYETVGLWALACTGLSCSLAIDVEIECKQPSDCAGGDRILTCGDEGTCVPASCEADDDCADLDGAICEEGLCAAPLCEDDASCQDELDSELALCRGGRCELDRWGCVGREDPREPEGDLASITMTIIDPISETPIPEPTNVQACAANDVNCNSALLVGVDYDAKTGQLKIERLPQRFRGFILIQGEDADGVPYMDSRFHFASRALINDEVSPDPLTMATERNAIALGVLAGEIDPPVVPARGVFLTRIHDCQEQLAAGVQLISDDPELASDAVLFYADGLMPNPDLSETTSTGAVGIGDLLAEGVTTGQQITFSVFADDERVTRFTVNAQPDAMNHVYVYPGFD